MTISHASRHGEVIDPPAEQVGAATQERLECLFYSESEAADRLGLHRTTLRALALEGRAPVEAIHLTEHRRVYRRVDIHRLAGVET
ncbi:hypothetical protein [Microbacterium sp. 2FI]|uniref:helix-turn-helix transcriptional regulator n=1 Tax=Microbacterium sp. 2FI TaxID=2502193 RepID=UPI001484E7E7|nr:hypothetical protein [Microbacterium sp. 2FI]